MVDLFDLKSREKDNHDISISVVHVLEIASHLHNIYLNEDLIDADMLNIPGVETDEEIVAFMCYIADCFTSSKEPDFENIDVNF